MKSHTFKLVITLALAVTAFVLAESKAMAGNCTLMKVSSAEEASLKVYFTRFAKEDSSAGKYKKCRLVRRVISGTTTFYVTPFRKDAAVIVHKTNWPR